MSELINNRQKQQEVLKEIILELHAGKSVDEVKSKFNNLIRSIGPGEIAQLENALMEEGIKEEEIQKLCDVHLKIFEDALLLPEEQKFEQHHPLEIFKKENNVILDLIDKIRSLLNNIDNSSLVALQDLHNQLLKVDDHYQKKEHLLFPYLEKKGVYAPPSVMWSTHDEIRDKLKVITQTITKANVDTLKQNQFIEDKLLPVLGQIEDMVNKEEKILFPLCSEKFTEADWQAIKQGIPEFGFTLVEAPKEYMLLEKEAATISNEGYVNLGSGTLSIKEFAALLNSLPFDITFVDKNKEVRYFTEGKDRIFPRPRTVIGRKVEKCHPPESVHIVDRIVNELEKGTRTSADFWINLKGRLIYIRYFAVRDSEGEFLGVLEVTQDITEIQQLSGEKRLLDDK